MICTDWTTQCSPLTRKTFLLKKVDLGYMKKHLESLKPADQRIPEEDVIISTIEVEVEDLPSADIKKQNPLEESDIKISIREDDGDDIRITVKDDESDDSESKSASESEEIARYKFPTF